MKKLLATMALAGFLAAGTMGCSESTPTKKPETKPAAPTTPAKPGETPPKAPEKPKG